MTRDELIRLFSDFSVQWGESYEERGIVDNYFDELAEVLLNKYQRISLEKDESGHDYVIPYESRERFSELMNKGEEAEDEFIDEFEKYMCGGDPFGKYEFYIKK